ncbi:MAG: class B sortase, partial [Defluviitaleaceae bacterium]|nr:class B sortase [Defluviitaleaceae bacterium]
MNKNTKLIILCIILGATFAFTAYFGISLALEIRANRQGEEFFATMPVDFVPRITIVPVPIVREEPTVEPTIEEYHTPEPESEPLAPLLDFDELRESFPSIVGWIQSEGTIINYPIVQVRDNDFYLRRLPDRTSHIWGSIYMDFRNASDF